jgi:hypothetical protein
MAPPERAVACKQLGRKHLEMAGFCCQSVRRNACSRDSLIIACYNTFPEALVYHASDSLQYDRPRRFAGLELPGARSSIGRASDS